MQRTPSAKKTQQGAKLPDEIWEIVFSFLSHQQLKSARLVSQEWNSIVCNSPKFLRKLTLSIPPGCKPRQLRKMVIKRYSSITVQNLTFETAPILENFSARKLDLKQPFITAGTMVRMLCKMPVCDLTIQAAKQFNYELFDAIPNGLTLTNLESLQLDLGPKDEFLCIFQSTCPNGAFPFEQFLSFSTMYFLWDELSKTARMTSLHLKRLKLKADMKRYLGKQYGAKLLEFVRSTRHSLKELYFEGIDFCHESLFRDVIAVEGLELKVLSIPSCKFRNNDIMGLFGSQTSITTLHLPASSIICNTILTGIGMHMTNLTFLCIAVDFVDVVPVLSNMPHLKNLQMVYKSTLKAVIDLSGYANPQLHTLGLTGFYLDSNTLLACFKKCPNIRTLLIRVCSMISVHDILVITGQLEELNTLHVHVPGVMSCPNNFAEFSLSPFRNLRDLTLAKEVPSQHVCILIEHCPVLCNLTLSSISATDADMVPLIDFMGNIRILCLENLPNISVATAERAVRQCSKLEKLRITGCARIYPFVPERSTVMVSFS